MPVTASQRITSRPGVGWKKWRVGFSGVMPVIIPEAEEEATVRNSSSLPLCKSPNETATLVPVGDLAVRQCFAERRHASVRDLRPLEIKVCESG